MGIAARQLLQAGRKTIRVAVPEWEGEIILRELSAAQAINHYIFIEALGVEIGNVVRANAWLVTAAWIDEAGAQVLTTGDIDLLLETQTPHLLERLALRIREISGAKADAQASAAKNSLSSQS